MFLPLILTLASSVYTLHNTSAQEEPPLSVIAFKGAYSIGMTVTLFGDVMQNPAAGADVTLKVNAPNGQTYKEGTAKLDETGSYTFEFKLEDNASLGVYTVEAKYQSLTANTSFEVKEKPKVTASMEKNTLNLGDMVVITGTVAPRLLEPVEIKIYNPNNTIWKFFAVSPDKILNDGTFRAEVGELSGKNSFAGNYRVEITYADKLATASLQFNVGIVGKVTPGRFMLVDQSGKPMQEVGVGQQVLVQADVRNNLQEKQPFAYLVLITDADGFTVSLSWITGTLPIGETLSAAQSWIPENAGNFTVKVFVWKSIVEPEPLSPKALETSVRVAP